MNENWNLNYYVVFKSEHYDIDTSCVIYNNFEKGNLYKDICFLHLFDKELIPLIAGYEYIEHLPRTLLDVFKLSDEEVLGGKDNPHKIKTFRSSELKKNEKIFHQDRPTLVIYDERCKEDVMLFFKNDIKPTLGFLSLKNLTTKNLKKNYTNLESKALTKLLNHKKATGYNGGTRRLVKVSKNIEVIDDELLTQLSLLFVAGQTNRVKKLNYEKLSFKEQKLMKEEYYDNSHTDEGEYKKNIVVVAPGISEIQQKYRMKKEELTKEEKKVLNIIGIHRAAAIDGTLIDLDVIPSELFECLQEIPIQGREKIYSTLKKIGKIFADFIGNDKVEALKSAKHITVFSDFPIGICILPETDIPLGFITPISHRQLTPLTDALTLELEGYNSGKVMNLLPSDSIKFLFVESIIADTKNNVEIVKILKDTYERLESKVENTNINVQYEQIKSTFELEKLLEEENRDANEKGIQVILVLSAHGICNNKGNYSAMKIGMEMKETFSKEFPFPKIVFLSSCSLSERSRGIVSVSDNIIRGRSVMALVTSQIPVDSVKNSSFLEIFIDELINIRKDFYVKDITLCDLFHMTLYKTLVKEIVDLLKCKEIDTSFIKDIVNEALNDKIKRNLNKPLDIIMKNVILYLKENLALKKDVKLEILEIAIKELGEVYEPFFYDILGQPEKIFLRSKYEDLIKKVCRGSR